MIILSEICLATLFHFIIFIGYYDKIEEYNNIEIRTMYGHLILYSITGLFAFIYAFNKDH